MEDGKKAIIALFLILAAVFVFVHTIQRKTDCERGGGTFLQYENKCIHERSN